MLPSPAHGFEWSDASWGAALRCAPLTPAAPHLFTTRPLPLPDDENAWERLAATFGRPASAIVRLRQVHGADVVVRRRGVAPAAGIPQADIAISDDPDLVLVVQVADCVPLLLADRRTGAVAVAHAGWRGTAAGVAGLAVRALGESFGSRPEDVVVAIGPSIGSCCYQVGDEVREAFLTAGHAREDVARWFPSEGSRAGAPAPGVTRPAASDRPHLDLVAANRDQLRAAGVPATAVYAAGLCTAHHAGLLCSYRCDGAAAGRMAGAIRAGAPARS